MNKRIQFAVTVALILTLLAACASPDAATVPPTITPTRFVIRITKPADNCPALSEAELAAQIVAVVVQIEDSLDLVLIANTDTILLNQVEAARTDIASAQDSIQIYSNLYAELGSETNTQLDAISTDLNEIAALLDDVITSLAVNPDAVPKLVNQLKSILAEAELRMRINTWQEGVQIQINERENLYMGIQPQPGQVANNRVDAFIQAHDFVEAFEAALGDGKFSSGELATISQLAVNAKASLYNTGDHQLFDHAIAIDQLTRSAARGEWSQACNGITELRFSLPARPSQSTFR